MTFEIYAENCALTWEQIQDRIKAAEQRGWTQCQFNGAYGRIMGVPPEKPSVFKDIPDFAAQNNS